MSAAPPADSDNEAVAPSDDLRFDAPVDLARLVAAAERPLLIGLDIDGVLSPLVDHADDASLLAGVADALVLLDGLPGVTIAAISGRALSSMRTFALPDHIQLIGSHGLEAGDSPMRPLDDDEQVRLGTLHDLAHAAALAAGDGAWVESKSASVAVHVRTADPELSAAALDALAQQTGDITGATSKPGSNVLELFARHASKGTALTELRAAIGAACAVFVGDDVTDEDAFATLQDGDISIKVGDAPTIAAHRLRDPADVLAWLRALDPAS